MFLLANLFSADFFTHVAGLAVRWRERILVACVIAETSVPDAFAACGPAPYQEQLLRICAEGRLTPRRYARSGS